MDKLPKLTTLEGSAESTDRQEPYDTSLISQISDISFNTSTIPKSSQGIKNHLKAIIEELDEDKIKGDLIVLGLSLFLIKLD
jgi:hypothetical protein